MAHPSESFFKSSVDKTLVWIIFSAILFHAAVIAVVFGISKIKIIKEPEMIPVFELVNLSQKAPEVTLSKQQEEVKPVEQKPVKELPKEPLPKQEVKRAPIEPKPKVTPVEKTLPPEPKIAPKEEIKEVVPEEQPLNKEPVEEPLPPKKDFDIDDMATPATFEKSSLSTVGSVNMDPQLQAFLERLKQLVMQNFNPPNGMSIPRDAKTTVQFTVNAAGIIESIVLKKSSGNKTWDALSMRAVQITKGIPLPATCKADALSLQFNFTPN